MAAYEITAEMNLKTIIAERKEVVQALNEFANKLESILEQDPKTEVLDKIRAEVEALRKTHPFVDHVDMYIKEDDVKKVIDKYKIEVR